MKPGLKYRDGYFMEKTLAPFRGHQDGRAHIRLQVQGPMRPWIQRRLQGHKAHGVSHHDPTFSRSKREIADRGVAMTAETSIFPLMWETGGLRA